MENVYEILDKIVKHNEKQMDLVDGDQGNAENLYSFEFEGVDIYNPFVDESMMIEVEPIDYYGIDNIELLVTMYINS